MKSSSPQRVHATLSAFPRRLLNKIAWLSKGPSSKSKWLFLARHFRIKPPDDHRFQFATVEEAIKFMYEFPRESWERWVWQEELLQATELPA